MCYATDKQKRFKRAPYNSFTDVPITDRIPKNVSRARTSNGKSPGIVRAELIDAVRCGNAKKRIVQIFLNIFSAAQQSQNLIVRLQAPGIEVGLGAKKNRTIGK